MQRLIYTLGLTLLLAMTASSRDPAVGAPELFASGVPGPEGLAFTKTHLIVGTTTGDLLRFAPDGTSTLLASIGKPLAGVSVLKDRRVVTTVFGAGEVWQVTPEGNASILAQGLSGPNFVVQSKRRQRIWVSASLGRTIEDVTDGIPVTVASGFGFPNGMAIGRVRGGRYLFLADTTGSAWRIPIDRNDTLGAPEVYATGLPLADGIALDKRGNLLVVGADTLSVVLAATGEVRVLSTDPRLDWPANLAFGSRRAFGRRTLYLANFGMGLGDGTTVIRLPYNIRGAKLIR
jgi:sugar lactone lactonase YvrE